MKNKYMGITYPKIFRGKLSLALWKRFGCTKNKHLFDEVWSPADHYLYCDACGLIVNIDSIRESK